jgi:hypothetical protein
MRAIYLCIFFSLCVFVAKVQASYWYDADNSSPLTSTACSNPYRVAKLDAHRIQWPELPVVYKSFNAKRLRSKVDLIWETTYECDNLGFEIQRKVGNSEWQKVAFVISQAADGNSSGLFTYEYTDVNTGKELSQYRLKQLDSDRSVAYSEVLNIGGY